MSARNLRQNSASSSSSRVAVEHVGFVMSLVIYSGSPEVLNLKQCVNEMTPVYSFELGEAQIDKTLVAAN